MKALKIHGLEKHKIPDSEVVKRIVSGEKELYEILMKRNNQKLYRIIRSYIKGEQEIEDIMQNTYLKAYEKLYQFKHSSEFSTWLIRIGINEALAHLKTKGKIFHINGQLNDFENDTVFHMKNRSQFNPEKKIIQQEARQFIESAIDDLGPKYKTVYMMREVEGMSIDEISECLSLSNSNVKVRIHRAKAILKEKLYELTLNNDVFEFGFNRCDNMVENVMEEIYSLKD